MYKKCDRCKQQLFLIEGKSGWHHDNGLLGCNWWREALGWLGVAGWGVAALVGFFLAAAFLSVLAAPIISNSN